jgi:hypothetical protein
MAGAGGWVHMTAEIMDMSSAIIMQPEIQVLLTFFGFNGP